MNRRLSTIISGGASILALTIASQSFAQQSAQPVAPAAQQSPQAPESAGELEEIVVTARRVQEKLQNVPIAVTAFTSKDLQEKQINSIDSLGEGIPNMYIQYTQFGSVASPAIQIRGVTGVSNQIATDSPIGIYLDGVYLARTLGLAFDLADLDQFEVLRGPQGTLFGKNTVGGALNMTTKAPTGILDGHLETSFGNYDMHRVKASFDLPEFDGFSVRATMLHKDQGFDRTDPVGGTVFTLPPPVGTVTTSKGYDNIDENGGTIAIRYTGVDDLIVDLKSDYSENFNGQHAVQNLGFSSADTAFFEKIATGQYGPVGPYVLPLVGPGVAQKSVSSWFNFTNGEDKAMGFNLSAAYDFSDEVTLKSISGYRWQRVVLAAEDLGGGALTTPPFLQAIAADLNQPGPGGKPPAPFPGDLFVAGAPFCYSDCTFGEPEATHAISEELQLIGHEERFDWLAGFFYFDEIASISDPSPLFGGSILPVTTNWPGGALKNAFLLGDGISSVENQSWAFYGHATDHLTDVIDLSAGIRYTYDYRYSLLYNEFTAGALDGKGPLIPQRATSVSYDNVDWDLSLSWKIMPDVNGYAKVSTGYLSGGTLATGPFLPIYITSYEVGVKSDWFDHRLRINIDGWHTKQEGTQANELNTGSNLPGLPPGTPLGSIIISNAGTHTNKNGIDIESLLSPFKGATLGFNAGFTSAPSVSGLSPGIPNKNFGLLASYDFPPVYDNMYFSIRADASWTEGYTTGGLPISVVATSNAAFIANITRPATWNLDLRGTLYNIPIGPVTGKISGWVKNLTDEQNLTFSYDIGSNASGTYDLPRTFGIDLAVDF